MPHLNYLNERFAEREQNYLKEQNKAEEALRASKTILTKAQQIAHVGSWERS